MKTQKILHMLKRTRWLILALMFAPAMALTATLFEDGFETGGRSTTQNSISWTDSVRTSVKTTVPKNGGYSLEFAYQAAADGADSFAEQRIALTQHYPELWVMFDLYVPTNFYHRAQVGPTNNKFFVMYRAPYTLPIGFQVNFSTGDNGSGGSNLGIHSYNNGVENRVLYPASGNNFLTAADTGRWHRIVLHVKVPTSATSQDGIMQLWKNGAPIISYTNLAIWGGIDNNYIDAMYVLGWSNAGFAQQTNFYVDNFVIANTPLGVNPLGAPGNFGYR